MRARCLTGRRRRARSTSTGAAGSGCCRAGRCCASCPSRGRTGRRASRRAGGRGGSSPRRGRAGRTCSSPLPSTPRRWRRPGARPVVAAWTRGSRERIGNLLRENRVATATVEDAAALRGVPEGAVALAVLGLERGFVAPAEATGAGFGLSVVGEQDLLGERIARPPRRRRSASPVHRRRDRHRAGRPGGPPGPRHRALRRASRPSASATRRTTACGWSTTAATSSSCRSRTSRCCRASAARRRAWRSTSWAARAGRTARRGRSSASRTWRRSSSASPPSAR